jgi:hypothetical protein
LSNRQGSNRSKQNGKQPKKITINLFIEEDVINKIRRDAEEYGVSLNARINGILTKYINFYKRAEEYGAAVIVSTQFAVFIELMDEEKAVDIMQTDGTATMIAYFQHNNIPITLDSIIQVAFANVAIASGVCTKFSQHTDEEGYRCLVFDHRYGIKWSRIISKVFIEDFIMVMISIYVLSQVNQISTFHSCITYSTTLSRKGSIFIINS